MINPLGYFKKRLGKSPELKEVYRLFKDVLDSNNRALEVITDMGEKLGGDYLFDAVYVRQSYARLSEDVNESIAVFDMLTSGGYPRLRDAFAGMNDTINGVINDTDVLSGRLVIPFSELTSGSARETGGKNATLAELGNRAGVHVPEGFALTTHAFDLFMRHNGLDLRVGELAAETVMSDEELRGLRDDVKSAELPIELADAISAAVEDMQSRCSKPCLLAVRSSAEEEDGEFSFAGQFTSVLGVPAAPAAVTDAYRNVVASLYSAGAVAYQEGLGYNPGSIKMAVGCIEMVDAVSSGVVFTSDPGGDRDTMLISASWGLGVSVVEGLVDADTYTLTRPTSGAGRPAVLVRRTGAKKSMVKALPDGGTIDVPVPAESVSAPCLDDDRIVELGELALRVEKHLGGPQDIEWAVGPDGEIHILQSRPLRLNTPGGESQRVIEPPAGAKVLMSGRGVAVQGGGAAGPVFVLPRGADPDGAPDGAVVVSETDSPQIARAAHRLAAVITDTGSATSHMASVCREFRLPTLVNTGNATGLLTEGQSVTLNIDEDGNAVVYEGIIREIVEQARLRVFGMEGVNEYRKKRRILRYISPLNLVDPALDNFSPDGCRTVHDVLRFIHEKSVAELVESSKRYGEKLKGQAPVKLDLPIPAGILVIDIGEGLDNPDHRDNVTLNEVSSLPLISLLGGMTHPGVWHSDIVSMKVGDFLSSMVRMPDIASTAGDYTGYNVAVASREYVNMSLRFGYHFNMLDCYMSGNARNNHIYFRFAGGATDITKRSRRIHLISSILREYGFNITEKGDLIIARLSNIPREKMEGILDQLGRLVSYTRQMDAVLQTDEAVEHYVKNFMAGDYGY